MEESTELGVLVCVRGWYFGRWQYSSSGDGAADVSLGAVHMKGGLQVRVQAECGREEVHNKDKNGERQNEEATRNGRSNAHHG